MSIEKQISMAEQILATRETWRSGWQEIQFYCAPEDEQVFQPGTSPGEERPKPLDGIGRRSVQSLSSGLFSNLISPGQEWFSVRPTDESLHESNVAKDYLKRVSSTTLRKIQNSNFVLAAHQMLTSLCTYGTGVLYVGYDDKKGLFYRQYDIATCGIAENSEGRVETIAREFRWTARQAYERWGNACSPKMIEAASDPQKASTTYKFVHLVYKRLDGLPQVGTEAKAKPFASFFLDMENKHVCEEGGYDSFPYMVVRFFRNSGEAFGRGPGHIALPEFRTLQRASLNWFDNAEMQTFPPILMPDNGDYIDSSTMIRPGALIPWDATRGTAPIPLMIGGDPNIHITFNEQRREAIEAAFYVDLFLALEHEKSMTATEVSERVIEKFQSIMPIVSRLNSEFTSPAILRSVQLLDAAGEFPWERPQVLEGPGRLEIAYTTRLEQKLALGEVDNFMRFLESATLVGQAMQHNPALEYLLKGDDLLRELAFRHSVHPDLLYDEQEQRENREAAEQAMAQMAAIEAQARTQKPLDAQRRPEPGSPMDMAQYQGAIA